MPDSSEIRIETCSSHGLRYNAASHSGCARCRKEAGEALASAARVTSPSTTATPQPPSQRSTNRAPMAGAVGLAILLVLLAGTVFYWAHTEVWTLGQEMFGLSPETDSASDPYQQLEELTERLSEAAEDMDPEAAEALREMGRQLRQQGVPIDVEGELNQDEQEEIRRQIEQIGPAEERANGDG